MTLTGDKIITNKNGKILNYAIVKNLIVELRNKFIKLSQTDVTRYLLREYFLFNNLNPDNLRLFRSSETNKLFFIIITQRIKIVSNDMKHNFGLKPLTGEGLNGDWNKKVYSTNRKFIGESSLIETPENNLTKYLELNLGINKNLINYKIDYPSFHKIILENGITVLFVESKCDVETSSRQLNKLGNIQFRKVEDKIFKKIKLVMDLESKKLNTKFLFTASEIS